MGSSVSGRGSMSSETDQLGSPKRLDTGSRKCDFYSTATFKMLPFPTMLLIIQIFPPCLSALVFNNFLFLERTSRGAKNKIWGLSWFLLNVHLDWPVSQMLSLPPLPKPHFCSNAWRSLGRVLGRDGNEHLQTLWTVSWINGRKLKDLQTAGIIDFIAISTASSAVACKKISSFINWLF